MEQAFGGGHLCFLASLVHLRSERAQKGKVTGDMTDDTPFA